MGQDRSRRFFMKVVVFNGSARAGGNTSILLEHVLAPIRAVGIQTEVLQLGGSDIQPCRGCHVCGQTKDGRCANDDDVANVFIGKMAAADGILIGSPSYFANLTMETKALIARAGAVARATEGLFRRKVAAAVIAARRDGEIHAFDAINHFFLTNQMIVPGSCHWNVGVGREKGDVTRDEEGLRTMRVLGENMAWLLQCMARHQPSGTAAARR